MGEAASGLEALELAGQLQPDLVLLDLWMPNLGGLDALPTLRKTAPAAKILILTMRTDPFIKNTCLVDPVGGSAVFYHTDVKVEKV